jgi:hypothetical protein
MYTVEKLFAGKHPLDNGGTYYGAGFAVMNMFGKIVTVGDTADVFVRRESASQECDYLNNSHASENRVSFSMRNS